VPIIRSVAQSDLHRKERLRALDGLRGFAILWVVLYHYYALPAKEASCAAIPILTVFARNGWIGVCLFFVLSGYLITNGLRAEQIKSEVLKTFWIKRAFRIVPPYALLLLSYFFARTFWPPSAPDFRSVFNGVIPLWSYGIFIQNIFIARVGYIGCDWLRVLWSMATEVQFYIFISLAMTVIPRRQTVRWMLLLIMGSVAFRFWVNQSFGNSANTALGVLLPARIDAFLFGSLLAFFPPKKSLGRLWGALSILTAVLAFMVVAYRVGFLWGSIYLGPLYYTIVALGCAVLVDLCTQRLRFVDLIAGSFPLVSAGRLSYFIYLFHMPVALTLFRFELGSSPFVNGSTGLLAMVTSFLLVWSFAWLSFKIFEGPLIGWSHALSRYYSKTPPPATVGLESKTSLD
jgi:peptidoglycan/LPS O-acetylase OafA/YrhL